MTVFELILQTRNARRAEIDESNMVRLLRLELGVELSEQFTQRRFAVSMEESKARKCVLLGPPLLEREG
jgi:hypothetical protein